MKTGSRPNSPDSGLFINESDEDDDDSSMTLSSATDHYVWIATSDIMFHIRELMVDFIDFLDTVDSNIFTRLSREPEKGPELIPVISQQCVTGEVHQSLESLDLPMSGELKPDPKQVFNMVKDLLHKIDDTLSHLSDDIDSGRIDISGSTESQKQSNRRNFRYPQYVLRIVFYLLEVIEEQLHHFVSLLTLAQRTSNNEEIVCNRFDPQSSEEYYPFRSCSTFVNVSNLSDANLATRNQHRKITACAMREVIRIFDQTCDFLWEHSPDFLNSHVNKLLLDEQRRRSFSFLPGATCDNMNRFREQVNYTVSEPPDTDEQDAVEGKDVKTEPSHPLVDVTETEGLDSTEPETLGRSQPEDMHHAADRTISDKSLKDLCRSDSTFFDHKSPKSLNRELAKKSLPGEDVDGSARTKSNITLYNNGRNSKVDVTLDNENVDEPSDSKENVPEKESAKNRSLAKKYSENFSSTKKCSEDLLPVKEGSERPIFFSDIKKKFHVPPAINEAVKRERLRCLDSRCNFNHEERNPSRELKGYSSYEAMERAGSKTAMKQQPSRDYEKIMHGELKDVEITDCGIKKSLIDSIAEKRRLIDRVCPPGKDPVKISGESSEKLFAWIRDINEKLSSEAAIAKQRSRTLRGRSSSHTQLSSTGSPTDRHPRNYWGDDSMYRNWKDSDDVDVKFESSDEEPENVRLRNGVSISSRYKPKFSSIPNASSSTIFTELCSDVENRRVEDKRKVGRHIPRIGKLRYYGECAIHPETYHRFDEEDTDAAGSDTEAVKAKRRIIRPSIEREEERKLLIIDLSKLTEELMKRFNEYLMGTYVKENETHRKSFIHLMFQVLELCSEIVVEMNDSDSDGHVKSSPKKPTDPKPKIQESSSGISMEEETPFKTLIASTSNSETDLWMKPRFIKRKGSSWSPEREPELDWKNEVFKRKGSSWPPESSAEMDMKSEVTSQRLLSKAHEKKINKAAKMTVAPKRSVSTENLAEQIQKERNKKSECGSEKKCYTGTPEEEEELDDFVNDSISRALKRETSRRDPQCFAADSRSKNFNNKVLCGKISAEKNRMSLLRNLIPAFDEKEEMEYEKKLVEKKSAEMELNPKKTCSSCASASRHCFKDLTGPSPSMIRKRQKADTSGQALHCTHTDHPLTLLEIREIEDDGQLSVYTEDWLESEKDFACDWRWKNGLLANIIRVQTVRPASKHIDPIAMMEYDPKARRAKGSLAAHQIQTIKIISNDSVLKGQENSSEISFSFSTPELPEVLENRISRASEGPGVTRSHWQLLNKMYMFFDRLQKFEYGAGPPLVLKVRRDYFLDDCFETLMKKSNIPLHYYRDLRIFIKDDNNLQMDGPNDDTEEAFYLFSLYLFSPYYKKLFDKPSKRVQCLHLNPASASLLKWFEFAGVLLALSFIHQTQLGVNLPLSFFKCLMNRPLTVSDIEEVDPRLYERLIWLKDNEITKDTPVMKYSIREQLGDVIYDADLYPDSGKVTLTEENKYEYIENALKWKLAERYMPQMKLFMRGFVSVLDPFLLDMFTDYELQQLVSLTPREAPLTRLSRRETW